MNIHHNYLPGSLCNRLAGACGGSCACTGDGATDGWTSVEGAAVAGAAGVWMVVTGVGGTAAAVGADAGAGAAVAAAGTTPVTSGRYELSRSKKRL